MNPTDFMTIPKSIFSRLTGTPSPVQALRPTLAPSTTPQSDGLLVRLRNALADRDLKGIQPDPGLIDEFAAQVSGEISNLKSRLVSVRAQLATRRPVSSAPAPSAPSARISDDAIRAEAAQKNPDQLRAAFDELHAKATKHAPLGALSKAVFDTMTPRAKMDFCLRGGKIVD